MALRRIKYEDGESVFRIEGGGQVEFSRDGGLLFPLDLAGEVSVAWLAAALKRYEEYYGGYLETIWLTETPAADLRPDGHQGEVCVEYEKGAIRVQAGTLVASRDAPRASELGKLFAPMLVRHRATWYESWVSDEGSPSLHISAALVPGSRNLSELYELGMDMLLLLSALEGMTELTPSIARHLISGGQTKLLLGQRECAWLDAKAIPYKLATEGEKWEVAKDVAAFANTGHDALLVFGVVTKKDPNGDVLDSLRPFPLSGLDVIALRSTLRERIVPLIPDLDVGVSEARGGHSYGWIYIPAQVQELRPFLVAGALNGKSFIGTHISIPFRVGEETIHLDASAVHSLLAAGRAVLRTG